MRGPKGLRNMSRVVMTCGPLVVSLLVDRLVCHHDISRLLYVATVMV
jgi:hypothetical protein